MKKMKRFLLMSVILCFVCSCGVEQFSVNTEVDAFQNGGRLIGESTKGMKKGVDFTKSGTMFILNIPVLSDFEVRDMAKKMNAEHYTIQTRSNLLSFFARGFTGGLIGYKEVKVIKREE